jgi:Mg/Co/Ni transporter MgtE
MGRVTEIAAGAVVTTGLLNMRRFEQRAEEVRIVSQLLDHKVTVRDSDADVRVRDIAMERSQARGDWYVTKAYVQSGGTFGRRTGSRTVSWGEVVFADQQEDQGAETLLSTMEDLRAADLAAALLDLPKDRLFAVARTLSDERLADVLEELPEDERVTILQALESERAADVLEEMDPDDAADLLSELPPERAAQYLDLMEPDEANDLRRLLSYDDYTAGGMMTTEPIVLPPDATIADALARVMNPELSPSLASQVYVVRPPVETPTGRYLGVAHIQALLRMPPSHLVSAVIDRDLKPISPDAPLGRVARYFATYNLPAVPVIDEHGHLLGAITVDDLIDHMLPEDWREVADDEEANDG